VFSGLPFALTHPTSYYKQLSTAFGNSVATKRSKTAEKMRKFVCVRTLCTINEGRRLLRSPTLLEKDGQGVRGLFGVLQVVLVVCVGTSVGPRCCVGAWVARMFVCVCLAMAQPVVCQV